MGELNVGWNHAALSLSRVDDAGAMKYRATLNSLPVEIPFEDDGQPVTIKVGPHQEDPGWTTRYDDVNCTVTK